MTKKTTESLLDMAGRMSEPSKAEQEEIVRQESGIDSAPDESAHPARPETKPAARQSAIPTRRGRIFKPRRIIVYGEGGCGKTTLVSDADNAIVFDLNNGSEMLDVQRYLFDPEDPIRGHIPRDLQTFIHGIRTVRNNPAGVEWAVIDLLGDVEYLAMQHIFRRDAGSEGKERLHSIESYGYGKGKTVLYDQMRDVFKEFDLLTKAGVGVILVAHAEVKRFANPLGGDYDRHIIKALDHKDASISSYAFGWADEVAFMRFNDKALKINGRGAVKGVTGNQRVLEFDHAANWYAKSRLPLPKSVDVGSARPWSFMRDALHRAYRATPADIRAEIKNELARIGDAELSTKVGAAVKLVSEDINKLTLYMQDLRRRPALESENSSQGDDE